MARIEVVSFDMEGTLIDHSFSDIIWEEDIPRLYAEKHRLSLEEARRAVMGEYEEIGDLQPEWYDVGYWFSRLGLDGDWRRLPEERREACRAYPEVPGVLRRLGGRFPLVVTSNTIREFLEIQVACLGNPFSQVFSAPSDFGEVKKSPEFYARVCGSLGVEPESLAHVGDHFQFDYEAPRALGVEAYYLDRSGETEGPHVVHDLEEFERLLSQS